eukprot:GHVS01106664.1.p1 GENE.GHVS01106664.1~~GHVS01106664.1.p1  ORF type:complete len:182 (-),score=48.43 GHVS01106664.1:180-662(-)
MSGPFRTAFRPIDILAICVIGVGGGFALSLKIRADVERKQKEQRKLREVQQTFGIGSVQTGVDGTLIRPITTDNTDDDRSLLLFSKQSLPNEPNVGTDSLLTYLTKKASVRGGGLVDVPHRTHARETTGPDVDFFHDSFQTIVEKKEDETKKRKEEEEEE